MAKTTSYIPPRSPPALERVRLPLLRTEPRPQSDPDVDIPTKYGLVYEDVLLRTEDGVALRSYLIMQRKEISHPHALHVDWADDQSNEDVRSTLAPHALHLSTW